MALEEQDPRLSSGLHTHMHIHTYTHIQMSICTLKMSTHHMNTHTHNKTQFFLSDLNEIVIVVSQSKSSNPPPVPEQKPPCYTLLCFSIHPLFSYGNNKNFFKRQDKRFFFFLFVQVSLRFQIMTSQKVRS